MNFRIKMLIWATIFSFMAYLLEYARGRSQLVHDVILSNPFTFVIYPINIIICRVAPFIMGIIVIVKAIILYRKAFKDLAITVAIGVITFFSPVIVATITPENPFLSGYAERVKPQIDIPVLQKWAVQTINDSLGAERPSVSNKPPGIGSLTFRRADITINDDKSKCYIKLTDGGHFIGYYGLSIGSQTFQCPENQYRLGAGVCAWTRGD